MAGSESAGRARYAARTVAGFGSVLAAGVLFALVLAAVAARAEPLRAADLAVVNSVNAAVNDEPRLVAVLHVLTDLGGRAAAWLICGVTVAWLAIRRLPRLATYVAATGLGAAALSAGTKAIVERARPLVDAPVATAPGASFPSGHALGSTVAYGVLLLVFLPVVPARWRRAAVVAVVTLVGVVGATRVALGVHYPSDVAGGWLLGVAWLGVSASAFRQWRADDGLRPVPVSRGLAPEDRPALAAAPGGETALPAGWHTLARLLVAAVVVWGALAALGVVVTEALGAVQRADAAAVTRLAGLRTGGLDRAATLAARLGGATVVVPVAAAAAALALALTRRWRAALFLLVAVGGQAGLSVAVSAVVERGGPPVDQVVGGLPPAGSLPAGRVAAAAALYGAIALLVRAGASRGPRYAAWAWAALATVGVGLAEVYRGVHHPTDALAAALCAGAWLAACWRLLRPAGTSRSSSASGSGPDEPLKQRQR